MQILAKTEYRSLEFVQHFNAQFGGLGFQSLFQSIVEQVFGIEKYTQSVRAFYNLH